MSMWKKWRSFMMMEKSLPVPSTENPMPLPHNAWNSAVRMNKNADQLKTPLAYQ